MSRLGGMLASLLLVVSALPLGAAAESGKSWMMYGGDAANTRFSSLSQINRSNVARLRVVWVAQLGSLEAQESTPLVVGDTLFVTTSAGPRYVYALNAKDGTPKWKYAPEIPADVQQTTCCGLDNRGVAHARGKLFLGRLDGYLVALDASTGKELWKTQVIDYHEGAAITSPPTIVKNLVITGYAGGEYGIRGAITAYDQDTGKQVWRTYTVPAAGEPAAETWMDDSWKNGGGAAWLVGSYDPQLNLIYFGASNAAPWGASGRGPDKSDYGKFTNLYTASTLALDADTGKIVWHYQTTPYDTWDYDGVNELVLADLDINGQKTPVGLKADRNGFFYVLNRQTGALISAEPFVLVNWAKGVDLETGRPVEVAEKRPRLEVWAKDICPNLFGGKNWEPMAYSPQTGPGGFMSEMVAWDPINQKKVWGSKEELPFLGGALATGGGLVFHGNIQGWFKALDAKTGEELWKFNAGSGISQGAITFELDGKQYIAVVSGRLKTPPSFLGHTGERIFASSPEGGALFVFELAD
jgi:alcohol dehydrogenase (cytochrome c)